MRMIPRIERIGNTRVLRRSDGTLMPLPPADAQLATMIFIHRLPPEVVRDLQIAFIQERLPHRTQASDIFELERLLREASS